MRETAGLDATVNEIVALYREAIADYQTQHIDFKAKAVSAYLHRWIPRYSEYEVLQAKFFHLQTEYERQQAELERQEAECKRQQAESELQQAEYTKSQIELQQIQLQTHQLESERQRLQAEIAALYNSTTMRLHQRLLKLPIVGKIISLLHRLATDRTPL